MGENFSNQVIATLQSLRSQANGLQSNITTLQSDINTLQSTDTSLQTQINAKEKSIPYQASAPTSPEVSDLWVDSSGTIPILKVYNGTSWVSLVSPADDDQNILANQVFR